MNKPLKSELFPQNVSSIINKITRSLIFEEKKSRILHFLYNCIFDCTNKQSLTEFLPLDTSIFMLLMRHISRRMVAISQLFIQNIVVQHVNFLKLSTIPFSASCIHSSLLFLFGNHCVGNRVFSSCTQIDLSSLFAIFSHPCYSLALVFCHNQSLTLRSTHETHSMGSTGTFSKWTGCVLSRCPVE